MHQTRLISQNSYIWTDYYNDGYLSTDNGIIAILNQIDGLHKNYIIIRHVRTVKWNVKYYHELNLIQFKAFS